MTNEKVLNKQRAWNQGKRVLLTVANSDPTKGGPFIKVEAREVWGLPPHLRQAAKRGS